MQPYSIYLHIPFCVHRCAYCDFNTYAGLDHLVERYTLALCREIALAGRSAQAHHDGSLAPIHTVFWGGGTPSLLPAGAIKKIMQALSNSFDLLEGAEITLEANPGTLSLEYLQAIHETGVNRLSLGMQSANPGDLMVLERQHDLEDVIQAVTWARQGGIDNLNLDLIFGIPHQSLDSWKNTLAMALSIRPEHLALYALTLEHGTPMAKWVNRGLLPEPDSDLAADMYEFAMERLEMDGFEQYEISNWAKRRGNVQLASRHNMQYWLTLPYLGFGAGAHGFANGYRTVNVLAPASYIKRLEDDSQNLFFPRTPATAELLHVDDAALQGEMMMMGLRLVQVGVRDNDFAERFGMPLNDVFPRQIRKLQRLGLIEWVDEDSAGRALRLTRVGRLVGNRVFREFI